MRAQLSGGSGQGRNVSLVPSRWSSSHALFDFLRMRTGKASTSSFEKMKAFPSQELRADSISVCHLMVLMRRVNLSLCFCFVLSGDEESTM